MDWLFSKGWPEPIRATFACQKTIRTLSTSSAKNILQEVCTLVDNGRLSQANEDECIQQANRGHYEADLDRQGEVCSAINSIIMHKMLNHKLNQRHGLCL